MPVASSTAAFLEEFEIREQDLPLNSATSLFQQATQLASPNVHNFATAPNIVNDQTDNSLQTPDNDNQAISFKTSTLHTVLSKGAQPATVAIQRQVPDKRLNSEVVHLLNTAEQEIELEYQIDPQNPNKVYQYIYQQIGAELPHQSPFFIRDVARTVMQAAKERNAKSIGLVITSHGRPVDEIKADQTDPENAEEKQIVVAKVYSANGVNEGKAQAVLTLDAGFGGSGTAAASGSIDLAAMQPKNERYILLRLWVDGKGKTAGFNANQNIVISHAMGPMGGSNFAAITEIADLPGNKKVEKIAEDMAALEALVNDTRHPDAPEKLKAQVEPALQTMATILADTATMRDLPIAFALQVNQTLEELATDPQFADNPKIAPPVELATAPAIKTTSLSVAQIAKNNKAILMVMAPPALRQEMGISTPATPIEIAQNIATPQGQAIAEGMINRAEFMAQLPVQPMPVAVAKELPLAHMAQLQTAMASQSATAKQVPKLVVLQQKEIAAQPVNPPLAVEASPTLDLAAYQALLPQLEKLQQTLQQEPAHIQQWPEASPAAQTLMQLRDNPLPQNPVALRQLVVDLVAVAPTLSQTSPAALINPAAAKTQASFKSLLKSVTEPAGKTIAADAIRENIQPVLASIKTALLANPDSPVLQQAAVNIQIAIQQNSEPTALQNVLQVEIGVLKTAAKNPAVKAQTPNFTETVQRFDQFLKRPAESTVQEYIKHEPARRNFMAVTGISLSDFVALPASPATQNPAVQRARNFDTAIDLGSLLALAATPVFAVAAAAAAIKNAAATPTNTAHEVNRFNILERLHQWQNNLAEGSTPVHIRQAVQAFRQSVVSSSEPTAMLEKLAPALQALLGKEPATVPLRASFDQWLAQTRETPLAQQFVNYVTAVTQRPQQVAAMRSEANSPLLPSPTADPLVVRDVVRQNLRQVEQAIAAEPNNAGLQAIHKALSQTHAAIDTGTPQINAKSLVAVEANLQTLQTLLKTVAANADNPQLQAATQTLLQQIAREIGQAAGVQTIVADPAALITNRDPLAAQAAAPAEQPVSLSISSSMSASDILGLLTNPKLSPEQRTFLLTEYAARQQQLSGNMPAGTMIYRDVPVSDSMPSDQLHLLAFDPSIRPEMRQYALQRYQQRLADEEKAVKTQQMLMLQQALDQQHAKAQADLLNQQQQMAALQAEQQRLATHETQSRQAIAMAATNAVVAVANDNNSITASNPIPQSPVVTDTNKDGYVSPDNSQRNLAIESARINNDILTNDQINRQQNYERTQVPQEYQKYLPEKIVGKRYHEEHGYVGDPMQCPFMREKLLREQEQRNRIIGLPGVKEVVNQIDILKEKYKSPFTLPWIKSHAPEKGVCDGKCVDDEGNKCSLSNTSRCPKSNKGAVDKMLAGRGVAFQSSAEENLATKMFNKLKFMGIVPK